MSYQNVFPAEILRRYEMREVRNAAAVIAHTSPQEFKELVKILRGFALTKADILTPGKNEGQVAKRLNKEFRDRGWREGQHDTQITSILTLGAYKGAGEKKATVRESTILSEGYKVDNVKGEVALDIEWNAKDGNLDRDVGAYRALHDADIIGAGVMITRTMTDLRDLGHRLGRERFLQTSTTTNLGKLEPRLSRGAAGGCPVLAIAITARCYDASK